MMEMKGGEFFVFAVSRHEEEGFEQQTAFCK